MQKEPVIYLAPIKGLTDRVYRNIFPKYFKGIDFAVSPFLSVKNVDKLMNSYKKEFNQDKNFGIKTIPQILSNNSDEFLAIANKLTEMEYETINWNLGCPYPMVVTRGKGAALLEYPEKIENFLDKVLPMMNAKLSIKLRLGMYSSDEILKLIPIFNKYELDEIIIHARTGEQVYSGNVNLDGFEQAMNLSKNIVVYNGDINSLSTFKNLENRFGSINRWMIGREILKNPFFAEEIKYNKITEEKIKLEKIENFIREMGEVYSKTLSGPIHLADKMKNIWFYLSNSFENSRKIEKKVKKISNNKHYEKFIDDFFLSNPKLKIEKE